jgi:urea transporter
MALTGRPDEERCVVNDVTGMWTRTADSHAGVRFVDFSLRGAGQVMFQNNPVTGLLIIVAVFVGAFGEHLPQVGIGAVAGLIVGTLTAMALHVDQPSLRQGTFGFSPLLTGVAVSTFLPDKPLMWVYLVIGAAVTTVVTLALSNVLKNWGVPASTFPFVLTSWFLMLGAYHFFRLGVGSLGPPALPKAGPAGHMSLAFDPLVPSMIRGVSQVFLIGNWAAGLIILAALAISSRWAALWAAVGAVVATLIAIGFGASAPHVDLGLYGFSAVLTAIALGCTFLRPSVPVAIYALLGIVFTVFIQAALNTALAPIGIPSFTAPFVFTLWLFLLPNRDFAPTPHDKPSKVGVVSKSTDMD